MEISHLDHLESLGPPVRDESFLSVSEVSICIPFQLYRLMYRKYSWICLRVGQIHTTIVDLLDFKAIDIGWLNTYILPQLRLKSGFQDSAGPHTAQLSRDRLGRSGTSRLPGTSDPGDQSDDQCLQINEYKKNKRSCQ